MITFLSPSSPSHALHPPLAIKCQHSPPQQIPAPPANSAFIPRLVLWASAGQICDVKGEATRKGGWTQGDIGHRVTRSDAVWQADLHETLGPRT